MEPDEGSRHPGLDGVVSDRDIRKHSSLLDVKATLGPPEVERAVYFNNHERNVNRVAQVCCCKDNHVSTSKYRFFPPTFIVVNLFEQFQRFANVYFLLITVLSSITIISAQSPATTAGPLLCVLLATMLKDVNDDAKRHESDRKVNSRETERLPRDGPKSTFEKTTWANVHVGDIIRVLKGQMIPADILIVSTSSDVNECFVDTAELDGETNLKRKCAVGVLSGNKTAAQCATIEGGIVCEPPNVNLEKLHGAYTSGNSKTAISNEEVLLRGCTLQNTDWIIGCVIYTGSDTKQMQNCGPLKRKTTELDGMMNSIVINIVCILFLLCGLCSIINSVWADKDGREFNFAYNYFSFQGPESSNGVPSGSTDAYADRNKLKNDDRHYIAFLSFWLYFILLSQLVPISMYVSVEFIRLGQSFLIGWDGKMYHEEQDTPAVARTTALTDELGQIDYIFSDKTGTLTQNVMKFNSCHIAGKSYEPDDGSEKCSTLAALLAAGDPDVVKFFKLLSLCHTVQVEVNDRGEEIYQAASPDEKALVEGAADYGMRFLNDHLEVLRINACGVPEEYELLHVIEFNSTRKRMSVVLRSSDQRILVLSKGADSIMKPLLSEESRAQSWAIMDEHLSHYSKVGLRTLVLAEKVLPNDEYEEWARKYLDAQTNLEGREEAMGVLEAELESNLTVVGATAIEDKLQDGVPETIKSLKEGGIKVWVLTGDKQETAINIGYSCQLLDHEKMLDPPVIINGNSVEQVLGKLAEGNREIDSHYGKPNDVDGEPLKFGLVVDGPTLTHILPPSHHELEDIKADGTKVWDEESLHDQRQCEAYFLKVASKCSAVICCRVSPLQKAKCVRMVKRAEGAITLAIGDGANDVSMIRAAHIGIGISGLEGRQAVLASDYSIAQFRFLKRLLLVHGRWSYMRMALFLRYFFYKSAAFSFCHLLFAFSCGASGLTVYDTLYTGMYNVVYTFFPIMFAAILEQDVSEDASEKFPILYAAGPHDEYFNFKMFRHSIARGFFHACMIFYLLYIAIIDGGAYNSDGEIQSDFYTFGFLLSWSLTIVANLQLGLELKYWMWLNGLSILLGPLGYLFIVGIMYEVENPYGDKYSYVSQYFGTFSRGFESTLLWSYFTLVLALCVLPDLLIQFLQTYLYPTPVDIVREFELLKDPSGVTKSIRKKSIKHVQALAEEQVEQEISVANTIAVRKASAAKRRQSGIITYSETATKVTDQNLNGDGVVTINDDSQIMQTSFI